MPAAVLPSGMSKTLKERVAAAVDWSRWAGPQRAGPPVDPGDPPSVSVGVGGVNANVDDSGARIRGWSVNRTDSLAWVTRALYVNGQRVADAQDTLPPNHEQTWVMDVDADPGERKVVELRATNYARRHIATVGTGPPAEIPGDGLPDMDG